MLSCVKLENLRIGVNDSYNNNNLLHKSHLLHTKKREVTDELGFTSNRAAKHIFSKSKNYRSINSQRFMKKNSSFITLKAQKGMSLVEVVVSMLILSILIIGGHYHFVYGRGQIALRKNYRAALQLAVQKIEDLKAANYSDITEGKTQETLALGTFPCNRCMDVNDVGLYKQVNVIIQWNQMGKERNVSLDTFIAPKG